ncbi:MAG: hypothetical protein MR270_02020 [Erysipelotrichaceae bacterium]|nr:hypothetical protein [Erysipelotrichaceae bacterium]
MINLFIIHSGNDSAHVLDEVVPSLLSNNDSINILLLGSEKYIERYKKVKDSLVNKENFTVNLTGNNWKKDSRKSISRANAVLVVVGNDIISKKDTIGYEVKYARKLGKLILLYKLNENIILPDFLKEVDQFTNRIRNIAEPSSLSFIRERLCNYDMGYYDIFSDNNKKSKDIKEDDINLIMDQYKMYQKTSEDLVARRQNVSSFYLTVNGSIITIASIIIGLIAYPQSLFIIIALGIFGIILDLSWMKLLEAYGSLNAAKMKVISLMEKQLPINVYDVEWKVMSDKLNKKKYVSFTDSEKRIPFIFSLIYTVVIAISIIALLLIYL